MQGDRERSLAAGMNDHVTKPIDINDLVNLIHDLIVPETRVG
jgi:two-component system, sensor histidine kinase and response regulator